ncbi:MAG: hypothetical protein A2Z16_17590 [Chloroflexi bacterium RBG_16_54_18]|nr:MAG: hypothetical protein A2Z16_17590 [Chloroflexi bacterium RBG_16_54_18]
MALLIVLLTGCSQIILDPGQDQPDPTGEPTLPAESGEAKNPTAGSTAAPIIPPVEVTPLMPAFPGTEQSIDPAMDPLIQMAKADLATRLGVPESEIEVLEARAVVWPDAALGCPQPGMSYIQIPFDGGLIVLDVGGQEYNYHTGGNDGLFLCEQSEK